jgi:ABC-type Mn2+/Zn2+ transport system ATPase subunit
MTGEGKGKVVNRGKKYSKIFVYIPKEVSTDTSFPFKVGEDVTVKIDGKRLIIEKRKQ